MSPALKSICIYHCQHCQTQFRQKRYTHIYCCTRCQRQAEWDKRRKAPLERVNIHVCPNCNNNFMTKYTYQIYCTGECADQAAEKRRLPRKRLRSSHTKAYIRAYNYFGTTQVPQGVKELYELNHQLKKLIRERTNVKHPGN